MKLILKGEIVELKNRSSKDNAFETMMVADEDGDTYKIACSAYASDENFVFNFLISQVMISRGYPVEVVAKYDKKRGEYVLKRIEVIS